MPISAGAGMAILGGANIVGGILQGNSAKQAAQQSAAAQLEAARIAADAAKFRPVGLNLYSQGLGESRFQTDAQGNVIGAEISSTPQFQNYQQALARMQEQQLAEAELAPQRYAPLQATAGGLFDLSSRYLGQSPEEVAQKYIATQQDLLAPSRERQLADLRNRNFQTGREGLSVGGTGLRPSGGLGLSAANPEMEAYYNALAQQDLQLASNAEQEARNRILFGQDLATGGGNLLTGYYAGQSAATAPFQTSLGLQGGIADLALTPLKLGMELGGRSASAGANVGQALLTGGINAARTAQAANAYNPLANVLQGAGTNPYIYDYMKNRNFGGTPQGAYAQQGQYLTGALSNPQTQQARMLSDQNAEFYRSPEGYSSFLY
jgi:hypothetical protein